ncbi:MAG: hypothetical protein AB8G95_21325 [Anaerolineae bacterium]
MHGITKTVPKSRGMEAIDHLYDGTLTEFEFHMAGKAQSPRLNVGDYVYTIFDHQIRGRCKIKEFIAGHVNPKSGKPRVLVMVECPGERLAVPIPRRGHQGTRYWDGDEWPQE